MFALLIVLAALLLATMLVRWLLGLLPDRLRHTLMAVVLAACLYVATYVAGAYYSAEAETTLILRVSGPIGVCVAIAGCRILLPHHERWLLSTLMLAAFVTGLVLFRSQPGVGFMLFGPSALAAACFLFARRTIREA